MSQEEIAKHIEIYARRLVLIIYSDSRAHNFEKEMLVKDIQRLAAMLRFTK